MSDSPVFSRVQPRTITIEETYHYQGEISRNTYIDLASDDTGSLHTPEGLITIELPYDGHRWLDEQARQDIDTGREAGLEDREAVVAYLAFDEVTHTDLPGRLALDPSHNAWPVILPLRDDAGEELADLIARDAVCHIRHNYQVDPQETEALKIMPVEASIGLTEEVDILDRDSQPDVMPEIRPGFESDLALTIKLSVTLPRDLGCQGIVLERASVRWPSVAIPDLFEVQAEEDEQEEALGSVQFDPEAREVVWHNLPLQPVQRDPQQAARSEYDQFKTSNLRLYTYRPTDLYDVSRLDATFELLLPGALLSGLQVRAFDATGKPLNWSPRSLNDTETSNETVLAIGARLKVDLAIWLEDIFHEKTYTPRRHLVFDGVIPTRERVEDIKGLLRDLGFESVDTLHHEPGPSGNIRFLELEANRTERTRQMDVRVVLQGETARTEAATYVRGGRSYTTEQTTGRTKLDIIVRQAADHSTLTETLNSLQMKLKERFLHVTEVK